MANRVVRNMVALAKTESTYGTDPTPTAADNAILLSNVSVNPLNAQNVDRDNIRSYLGGSEQLVGTAYAEVGFDVELQSSGTKGTAPAWGPLLLAAGFSETVTASTRVDYLPATDALDSVTIYLYDSGVLHKLTGARGNVALAAGVGERPVLRFNFVGLYNAVSAASNPTPTLTGWKVPKVITDANTSDLTFGCTYSAGALSGGTAYPSRGINIDMGNEVNFTPLLGGETVELTQRAATGSVELDLTAANEVTFMGNVLANTTQSIGFTHGSGDGYTVLVHAPAVQLINPSKADFNGKRLIGFDLRLVPSSGNDELRICCL